MMNLPLRIAKFQSEAPLEVRTVIDCIVPNPDLYGRVRLEVHEYRLRDEERIHEFIGACSELGLEITDYEYRPAARKNEGHYLFYGEFDGLQEGVTDEVLILQTIENGHEGAAKIRCLTANGIEDLSLPHLLDLVNKHGEIRLLKATSDIFDVEVTYGAEWQVGRADRSPWDRLRSAAGFPGDLASNGRWDLQPVHVPPGGLLGRVPGVADLPAAGDVGLQG